ncbi:MAG: VOC family protein [Actinomycetota bacterium]
MTVRFNHVGHCVHDLERSTRFYCDLLGFTVERELRPPDEPSARLLGLEPPLGMTAVYLSRDGFVLELLHYSAPGRTQPRRVRAMDEPGLTHLSVSVEDIDAVCEGVAGLGGEVVAGTHVGSAVFIRDPDGQLIELLPMAYRRQLDERGFS